MAGFCLCVFSKRSGHRVHVRKRVKQESRYGSDPSNPGSSRFCLGLTRDRDAPTEQFRANLPERTSLGSFDEPSIARRLPAFCLFSERRSWPCCLPLRLYPRPRRTRVRLTAPTTRPARSRWGAQPARLRLPAGQRIAPFRHVWDS